MSDFTLRFLISQAAPGLVFTLANGDEPMKPGNFAGWSSPSYRLSDSVALSDLSEDGGHWVGNVYMLPDAIFNMTATYFPVKGSADNVQLAGPIVSSQSESLIAIVGGGGQFAGARGQARCTVVMSDAKTPLYRYELTFRT